MRGGDSPERPSGDIWDDIPDYDSVADAVKAAINACPNGVSGDV